MKAGLWQVAHCAGNRVKIADAKNGQVSDHAAKRALSTVKAVSLSQSLRVVRIMLLAVVSILDCPPDCTDAGMRFKNAIMAIQQAELQLNDAFLALDAHPGGLTAAVGSIVHLTSRLHVIQDTKYLSAGYALMDGMVLLVFVLMTISNWPVDSPDSLGEGIAYTIVIGYLYSYLRVFIGDLENPFAYPDNYCLRCLDEERVAAPCPTGSKNLWGNAAAEFRNGGAIQAIAILTVTYGKQLKRLMKEADMADNKTFVREREFTAAQRVESWLKEQGVLRSKNEQELGERPKQPMVARRAQRSAIKWRLALRSLPVVVGLIALRLAVWYGAGVGGWLDAPSASTTTVGGTPSLFTTFMTLVVFVCTVVMQGLLQDYKEAERMPSELVTAFYGFTSAVRLQHRVLWPASEPPSEPQELFLVESGLLAALELLEVSGSGYDHVQKGKCITAMEQIDSMENEVSDLICKCEKQLKTRNLFAYKVMQPDKHFETLRSAMSRALVIQVTSYILEAYTLMDLMVFLIFSILTTINWPVESAAAQAAGFTVVVPFLFTYLGWFVRSLESPFEYPRGHLCRCYYAASAHVRHSQAFLMGQRFGGSIDLAPLTVWYGQILMNLLDKVPEEFDEPDNVEQCFSCPCGATAGLGMYFLRRYRLMLQCLPFVSTMLGFRFCVWYIGGVDGWVDPSVPLNFVSLAIFVTSFLLQGVIQDYRDAERLPCLAAVALQGIASAAAMGVRDESRLEEGSASLAKDTVDKLLNVTFAVLDQKDKISMKSRDDLSYMKQAEALDDASFKIFEIFSYKDTSKDPARLKITDAAWDSFGMVGNLRRLLGRARVIKQTSFTLDGYTLMDAVLLAVCVLLTLAEWSRETQFASALCSTAVISGLFFYMALLIRSLENPFKYPAGRVQNAESCSDFTSNTSGGHCSEAAEDARMATLVQSCRLQSAITGDAIIHQDIFPSELRNVYSFSLFDTLDCGTPIDHSILTQIFAVQLARRAWPVPKLQATYLQNSAHVAQVIAFEPMKMIKEAEERRILLAKLIETMESIQLGSYFTEFDPSGPIGFA